MNNPLHIPSHSLGISRNLMPQVAADSKRFLADLEAKGVSIDKPQLYPEEIKATQSEFNHAGIRHIMKTKPRLTPPIISKDHYVLDGHHRWLAKLNSEPGKKMPVIRVGLNILDLLAAASKHDTVEYRSINQIRQTIKEALTRTS